MTKATSTIERIARALFDDLDVSGKSWQDICVERPDVARKYIARAKIAVEAMIPPDGSRWASDVHTLRKHAENILAERYFEEE